MSLSALFWFSIALFTSSAEATEVSIPIPKLPNALPQADVSQFSTKDTQLKKEVQND